MRFESEVAYTQFTLGIAMLGMTLGTLFRDEPPLHLTGRGDGAVGHRSP